MTTGNKIYFLNIFLKHLNALNASRGLELIQMYQKLKSDLHLI